MGETVDASDTQRPEIERARAALRSGTGVFVIGDPGSGRTHFVRTVLEGLPGADRARVWVGDEIHRLDEDRADLLARGFTEGRFVPLATVASRRPLSGVLEALCRDGLILRIDLPRLEAPELLRAVETFLGAPLDPSAVAAFIPRRSGGDLVVLQESVREAQSAGVLRQSAGTWQLTGPVPPNDGLRRLVLSRIGGQTAVTPLTTLIIDLVSLVPDVAATDVVSLVQGLMPDDGQSPQIRAATEQLEADGVIDAFPRPSGLRLRVRNPVIELVLPQTLGHLRRERLLSAVVDVLGRVPAEHLDGSDLVAHARHTLALGREVDPAHLVKAAHAALRSSQAELSLQLAGAAVHCGGGLDAHVALAAAESQLGRSSEALARLAGLESAELDAAQASAMTTLIDLIRARVHDPAFGWSLPTNSTADPDTIGLESQLRLDRTRDSMALPDDDAPDNSWEVLEGERLAQAAFEANLMGEFTRAHELLDAGEHVLGPVGADMLRLHVGRAFLYACDGRMEEGLAQIERLRDASAALGQVVQLAQCALVAGSCLCASGRATAAIRELGTGLAIMEKAGMGRAALNVRAQIAVSFAQVGDLTSATDALEVALTAGEHEYFTPGGALEARGWIRAMEGKRDEAVAAFLDAADVHLRQGLRMTAVTALVEAARAGAARAALPRLEILAPLVEGVNFAVMIRHARALARLETMTESLAETAAEARDPEWAALAAEFDMVAAREAAAWLNLHAAEAYTQASRLHAASGEERAAAASARHATEQFTICGLDGSPFSPPPALLPSRSTTVLSSREREIAVLAAVGHSNREIATELVLSVRTVETHLQRIYRKLGVRSRSELSDAVAPIARP